MEKQEYQYYFKRVIFDLIFFLLYYLIGIKKCQQWTKSFVSKNTENNTALCSL